MIIWLVSYPRSGNSFTRILMEKVFQLEDTYTIHYNDMTDRALVDVFGRKYLENDKYIELARKSEKKYFVKTHDLPDEKVDPNDRFIYIIRDGRNSTVSYQHFMNDFTSQDKSVEDIVLGNVLYGSWHKHVSEWEKCFNITNSLILKFENIVSNPIESAETISQFVSMAIYKATIPTFNELHKRKPKFFRKGKSNSWEESYSAYEYFLFWVRSYKQMVKYGYIDNMPKMLTDSPQLFKELSQHIKELSQHNSSLMGKLSKLSDENIEAMQKVALLNYQLQEMENKVEDIYQSKKYKLAMTITYPYRSLVTLLGNKK